MASKIKREHLIILGIAFVAIAFFNVRAPTLVTELPARSIGGSGIIILIIIAAASLWYVRNRDNS